MDARLVNDIDLTALRIVQYRKSCVDLPLLTGQREAQRANPDAIALRNDQRHLRGLVAQLDPSKFEDTLIAEFKATASHLKKLTAQIEAEGSTVPGQRGTYAPHALIQVRADQQMHLRGLVRLMQQAKAEVPVDDTELAGLLD